MPVRRKSYLDGLESAPRWIVLFLAAYLIVDLFALYLWNAAGQGFPAEGISDGAYALSVTGMAGVDLWLCLIVLRSFTSGAPLRSSWMLITLGAAARAVSGIVAQFLGSNWLLNPLVWTGHARTRLMEQIRHGALIAGGPVRLVLLAAAMLTVLRVLRKFGFWVRPSATDWAMSGIVCLFTVCRFGEAGAASLAGRPISLENWISLAGLPILCVLFLEAMLLRQSIVRMGNGLLTRGWIALVCGVVLTEAGEMALWVIPHYSFTQPLVMFGALIRLPIAAAFALLPAFQVAAQCRAMKAGSSAAEKLVAGVPVLAR
jgi:hypothetical protein